MINTKILKNSYRHDVVSLLQSKVNNIGVELGVAEGIFSHRMVESNLFSAFFGVDMYSDMHDINEYKTALKKIGIFSNYKLLRMTFEDAYDLFDEESLDFVYVDGYAHNGEEGGRTIFEWSKKVKIGGVLAGDDYHNDWPLVQKAVDEFVRLSGFDLYVTSNTEKNSYCNYPSWATIIKSSTKDLSSPVSLISKGNAAKRPRKSIISYIEFFLQENIPKKIVIFLKLIKKSLFRNG